MAIVPATVAAAEGLVALGFAVWSVRDLLLGDSTDAAAAGFIALLAAVLGVTLLGAARGLMHGRRWARGPVLTLQVFLFPVAWTLLQADRTVWAAVVAVTAVVGAVSVSQVRDLT